MKKMINVKNVPLIAKLVIKKKIIVLLVMIKNIYLKKINVKIVVKNAKHVIMVSLMGMIIV
jgi:hypothetical protein